MELEGRNEQGLGLGSSQSCNESLYGCRFRGLWPTMIPTRPLKMYCKDQCISILFDIHDKSWTRFCLVV
jgi:hypothetical protein